MPGQRLRRAERAAQVIDLSECGASIAGVTAVADGLKGSMLLSGSGAPLPFTVMHAGIVHVVFRLDDAGVRQLRSLPERFANSQTV